MLMQKRMTVWLLETACEALLVSVLLIVLSLHDGPSQLGLIRDLAFGFFATLLVFCTTGYVFTTALAAIFWRNGNRVWLYPFLVALFFSIHLQILFSVASGWSPAERLPVRIGGPCIAFGCTYLGGIFLRRRVDNDSKSANSSAVI
jgi:hypothetical protein